MPGEVEERAVDGRADLGRGLEPGEEVGDLDVQLARDLPEAAYGRCGWAVLTPIRSARRSIVRPRATRPSRMRAAMWL